MPCYDDAAYADSREKITEAKTKSGRKRIERRDEEKQFTDKRHHCSSNRSDCSCTRSRGEGNELYIGCFIATLFAYMYQLQIYLYVTDGLNWH